MKKILLPLILLLLGLGLGGGAAFGVSQVMGPPPAPDEHGEDHAEVEEAVETTFVPAGIILAPVMAQDGYLSGYANFEVELEVAVDKADEVTAKLPLLLHAVNLRAFQTPMAAGAHYMLPDLKIFAKMVEQAAEESLGKGEVVRVMVISAKPV